MGMIIGYLMDGHDVGLNEQVLSVTINDTISTVTTSRCGYFSTNIPYPSQTVATIDYEGNEIYKGSTKTLSIADGDELPVVKGVKINGGWSDNTLAINGCRIFDITSPAYYDVLEEWVVKIYDENNNYITTLTETNNTYQSETPFSAIVVYEEDCENGIVGGTKRINP